MSYRCLVNHTLKWACGGVCLAVFTAEPKPSANPVAEQGSATFCQSPPAAAPAAGSGRTYICLFRQHIRTLLQMGLKCGRKHPKRLCNVPSAISCNICGMYRVHSIRDSDDGSDSDPGTSGQSSAQNRGGRPINWFRKHHFRDCGTEVSDNRKILECKHCEVKVSSRVIDLKKHLVKECRNIASEVKTECEKQVVSSTVAVKRPFSGLSRTSLKLHEGHVAQFMHPKVPQHQQAVLNRKMFLLFCMNGLPFHVANSPYFLDFVQGLNKNFKPAGMAWMLSPY